jgi:hypothetical protein
LGVAKVIADLASKCFVPCVPLSEHQPYDLVAISNTGKAIKLQVKFATLKSNGTVAVGFRTSWADRNGTHIKRYSAQQFDYYALYCPENDVVLYIPNSTDCPKSIRFEKPKNNQGKLVRWSKDYLVL